MKAETNSKEQQSFTLNPGETKTFLSYTVLSTNNENNGEATIYGSGSMTGPNLILSDNNQSRLVGSNL